MKKTVFVINGAGGVGKDTLCDLVAEEFRVTNISSITPMKEIATMCGWNGKKDKKSRKFLSDLKRLCIDYNDYPTLWAKERFDDFMASDEELMFVHIREPEEIAKFVKATGGVAKTLLIRGGRRFANRVGHYGNVSDDCVEEYAYDYYFTNDSPLCEAKERFVSFLLGICIASGDF